MAVKIVPQPGHVFLCTDLVSFDTGKGPLRRTLSKGELKFKAITDEKKNPVFIRMIRGKIILKAASGKGLDGRQFSGERYGILGNSLNEKKQ